MCFFIFLLFCFYSWWDLQEKLSQNKGTLYLSVILLMRKFPLTFLYSWIHYFPVNILPTDLLFSLSRRDIVLVYAIDMNTSMFSPLLLSFQHDLALKWCEHHSYGSLVDSQSCSHHPQSTDLQSKMPLVVTIFHNVSHSPLAWVVLK